MSGPRKLLFISSHRHHPKVADRLIGALAAGLSVDLYAFDRGTIDHAVYHDARVVFFSLGPIDDGVGPSRLRAFIRAVLNLRNARLQPLDTSTLIVVNTLEMLLISWFSGLLRFPLIYDVADIHILLLAKSLPSRVARWLERHALRKVDLLVVSSPWFFWEYFRRRQHSSNPAVLIENKIGSLSYMPESMPRCSARIAWNGLLRCQRSAQVLIDSLTQAPGKLHLSLHGSLARLEEWGAKLLRNPDCTFTGAYTPAELAPLLVESSFVWGVDYADGENSAWLLPNRLYEAIAAGVPLIVVRGSATAEVVAHYRIGLVLEECTPHAVLSAVLECDASHYAEWVANMRALRPRVERGKEWQNVFTGREQWPLIGYLPAEPELSCVLRNYGTRSPRLRFDRSCK